MKLGSLFDGSGGFPLAGAIHGISPAWAAEIEPYPIRVTKARFPQMKHLGSVLDVNGADVEPVDIITFGSPCQDLSVAGKQAGLHKGERSNLFFEAIRIIKEMRESTNGKYPRIAVWENVPGAYSSNKGEDFRAVLQAFCSVKDETADVPRPASGKWNPAGAIVGNGWSIAWRTFDAQYWGVPQRRKRIYLIADFGSERAGEVLLVEKSVHGNTQTSGEKGQGVAGDAAGSVGRGVQCLNPSMPQSSRIYSADGVYPCLSANETGGLNRQAVLFEPMSALEENWAESSVKNALRAGASKSSHAVCHPIDLIRESRGAFEAYDEDAKIGGSLKQSDNKGSQVVCYPINTMVATRWKADDGRTTFGIGDNGDPQFTIGAAHEHAVCYSLDRASFNQGINAKYDICIEPELNSPLVARGPSAVCYPIDSHQQDSRFRVCENRTPTAVVEKCAWDGSQVCSTLTANNAGGNQRMPDKANFNAVIEKVRNGNADAKKAGCREVLLGLWRTYVEETLQRCVGEQQGIQQTEVLRPEVHGSALDEQTQDGNELHGESCHCEEGKGCWVLRNMREVERNGCPPQGQELSEQQPGELDADMSGLPQQATQDSGEVQGVREESQRAGILREALSKVQEIWQPTCNKNQPIQRKYIIRRLTPLEACRLQGFPDWWEDGVQGSDSARYKMWGNGIALPNAEYVIGCAKKLIQEA